jgi:hypothetical protein
MTNYRVGISQSNYIPWLGYFELISKCDVFVFLESVQYTKNDWRNRNIIRTNNRPHWLTIPVKTGNSMNLKLNEVTIADPDWVYKHLKILENSYKKKLDETNNLALFGEIYNEELNKLDKISEINIYILNKILNILDIKTKIVIYSDTDNLEKHERILKICQNLNATSYVSTEKGNSYLDKDSFYNADIDLEVINFEKSINYLSKDSGGKIVDRYSILDSMSNHKIHFLTEALAL